LFFLKDALNGPTNERYFGKKNRIVLKLGKTQTQYAIVLAAMSAILKC
jgi:hypothetical protein